MAKQKNPFSFWRFKCYEPLLEISAWRRKLLLAKATGADIIDFIEPMYALAAQKIPEGKEWLYEVKFDGYRCLAGKSQNGVTLWSRRGNLFTTQFPRIAYACERLPAVRFLSV